MDINLVIVISVVLICLLVILITLLLDSYVRIKNRKLQIDKKKLVYRYEFEIAKNYELQATLEYIRNTGKIPSKVLENKYEFMQVEKHLDCKDPVVERLKERYKNLQPVDEHSKIRKEKINEYIASQNLAKSTKDTKDRSHN